MKRTRGLSHDIALGGLPADVDPFAYISQLTTRRFTPRLPQSAIVLVAVFLVFHVLLAAFNLIILVLPYVGNARRTPWFSQKLYIYSRSGEKLYRTPLYLVNSGVLMSISQLLASVTTQAYIWMQIKMNLSEHFSLRCQFFPALGLMFIFNSYSYWSMTHCFLALYYSNKTFAVKSRRLGWLRSPLSINLFFLIFPISLTVATIVVVTRMSMVYHELQVQTRTLRATLNQGSQVWKQLQLPIHSAYEKESLSSQLTQTQAELESLLQQTGTLVPKLSNRFNSVRSIMLFFIPATSLVFVLSYWKLTEKYKQQGSGSSNPTLQSDLSDSWKSQGNCKHLSVRSCGSRASKTFLETLRSDPQFFRLTMRAFATLLGMLTGMVFWLLAIFKLNEMMIDPYWHGVATWLPTVSGSWTAIPVAWQSWRIYLDQKPQKAANSSCKLEEAPFPKEHSGTGCLQLLPQNSTCDETLCQKNCLAIG
ncbi:hypothetical protein PGT21_028107 [Puccinia graminis f. sp. tritici]|nr:hypothetical protein PGT21_028107 [Puccinia graminis f. sp. tritici]